MTAMRAIAREPGKVWLGLRKVVMFGGISVLSTLVDFGLFNLFTLVTTMSLVMANALSYGAGIVVSYGLNKHYTFKGGGRDDVRVEIAIFLVINLVGLAATTLGVLVVNRVFGDHLLLLNAGKLAAGVVVWVLKYVTFERWVYPPKAEIGMGRERATRSSKGR
jgi:putative flippase GtrA